MSTIPEPHVRAASSSDHRRVIFLSSLPPPAGGISTWTRILLERGLPDGWEPALVNTAAAAGDDVFARALLSWRQVDRTRRIVGGLRRELTRGDAAVVHLNIAPLAVGILRDWVCARLARNRGVPVVVHHHGLTPALLDAPNARFLLPILDRLMRLATVNIVMNEPSRAFVAERLRDPDAVIENVPNFFDERSMPEPGLEPRNPDRVRKVAFVAGMTLIKGAPLVVEVARELPDVEFHLYGKVYDEVRADLDAAPANAVIHGEVDHDSVVAGLRDADLFLFPTIHPEGFPYGVLEAMAMGLPVVSTRVGAIPEMVEHERGGLLCERSAAALAAAVESLLSDEDRRARMGGFNRDKASRLYTYPPVARRLSAIYARASGGPATPA
jgi:glycosyltransferase involved in cell wall biosynthesis